MRAIATVFVAAALVAGRVEASRGLSESPKPTPSPMCETCEEFVTMGEAYLNDPATLNAITDKVNEVCETYAGTKHEAMVRCRPTPFLPPGPSPRETTDSSARVISRSGRTAKNQISHFRCHLVPRRPVPSADRSTPRLSSSRPV